MLSDLSLSCSLFDGWCVRYRVDEHEIVKVADFGLSRDLFSRDYYRIEDGKTPLPVRWMAPECLTQNVFTSMSDVVRTLS